MPEAMRLILKKYLSINNVFGSPEFSLMNKQIHIRKATAVDKEGIYRFICLLEEAVFDEGLFETYYLENICNPHNIYLVAEEINNSKLVGYISCHGQILLHHLGFVYEIQEMFVDDGYRNWGIGKALIQKLQESLPVNCKSLEVTAQNKRLASHAFYEATGFIASHLKFTKIL